MGYARNSRGEPESIIPEDVRRSFDETDIKKTWDYLAKMFHLNVKFWKADFERKFNVSSREINKMEFFVRYGKENFEPALNVILGRNVYHQTWMNLIRFVVKDKIVRLAGDRVNLRNYYK
jgi:hypothetical protein